MKPHVAQAAISQTVASLQEELGVELFVRSGRSIRLTPEGEIFYEKAREILKQSEAAIETVKRASRGEVGTLNIGFCGPATYPFMPDLVRKFKVLHPGVRTNLFALHPTEQEAAFAASAVDIGFNRPLSADVRNDFECRVLFRERMLLAVPKAHALRKARAKLEEVSAEPFILYHRKGDPETYDSIVRTCHERGFAPKVETEPNALHTVLALVAADQGVSVVPACARRLHVPGIRFIRLQPDTLREDLVLMWKKSIDSPIVKSFVNLTLDSLTEICKKAALS